MDSQFQKPKTSRAAIQATISQARASVDTHLQGRMPSRQQTSATLHGRMAPTLNRAPGPAHVNPAAPGSQDASLLRQNSGSLSQLPMSLSQAKETTQIEGNTANCDAKYTSEGNTGPNPSTGNNVPNPSTGNNVPNPSEGNTGPNPSKGNNRPNPSTGNNVPNPSKGNNVPNPSEGNTGPNPPEGNNRPNPPEQNAGPNPSETNAGSRAQTGNQSQPKPTHFETSTAYPSQNLHNHIKKSRFEPQTCPKVCVPAQSHIGPCKNPQCAACGTVIIPSPKATYPIQERPSITVGDWSVFTVKGPICSSDELDMLNDTRYDFPLPEMIFGKNSVRLYHEKTGGSIEFNTLDALDSLGSHADYKVAYYKEWLSTRPKAEQKEHDSEKREESQNTGNNEGMNRGSMEGGVNKVDEGETDTTQTQIQIDQIEIDQTQTQNQSQIQTQNQSQIQTQNQSQIQTQNQSLLIKPLSQSLPKQKLEVSRQKDIRDYRETSEYSDSPPLESVKPYDWTYSTNYTGTLHQMQFQATEGSIPLEKLVRQDPILFFDESILFEDELGDNGISMYSTKVRVMASCLLLLGRFSMRIDDVAFRIRDTRVYIDFETGLIMREYKCQEASYDTLLRKVSGRSSDPKKLLRDSNWVSSNTPVVSRKVEIGVVEPLQCDEILSNCPKGKKEGNENEE